MLFIVHSIINTHHAWKAHLILKRAIILHNYGWYDIPFNQNSLCAEMLGDCVVADTIITVSNRGEINLVTFGNNTK